MMFFLEKCLSRLQEIRRKRMQIIRHGFIGTVTLIFKNVHLLFRLNSNLYSSAWIYFLKLCATSWKIFFFFWKLDTMTKCFPNLSFIEKKQSSDVSPQMSYGLASVWLSSHSGIKLPRCLVRLQLTLSLSRNQVWFWYSSFFFHVPSPQ